MKPVTIFRNVPFVADGVNCFITDAYLATLNRMYIKVKVQHRVGQVVKVKYSNCTCSYSSELDAYYIEVSTKIFPDYSGLHDVLQFLQMNFHPYVYVDFGNKTKLAYELLRVNLIEL